MQDRFNFRVYSYEQKRMIHSWDYTSKRDFLYGALIDHRFFGKGLFRTMQSTGLKDKNGKLIYEGDIIKVHTQGDILINYGVVFWNYKEARFLRTSNLINIDKQNGQSFWYNNSIEIIGNIYENPELLEDK